MSEGTGGEPLRAPDPPLRSQAVVAARWTGVQLVVGRAVTVATTILLARALLAEELGVIAILTHQNAPRLAYRPHKAMVDAAVGERLHVLQDDRVSHPHCEHGRMSRWRHSLRASHSAR